eukprot:730930-Amphidinium_carterae.1
MDVEKQTRDVPLRKGLMVFVLFSAIFPACRCVALHLFLWLPRASVCRITNITPSLQSNAVNASAERWFGCAGTVQALTA